MALPHPEPPSFPRLLDTRPSPWQQGLRAKILDRGWLRANLHPHVPTGLPMKKNAFAAYRQNQLQGIQEASPIKLVSLLLDEAIACCLTAAAASENGSILLKGQSLRKAMAIIDAGLLDALDHTKGGSLAANLASVYGYCLVTLAGANVSNDPSRMRECAALLSQIREGWRAAEALDHS